MIQVDDAQQENALSRSRALATFLQNDPNGWASLSGLLAILALPARQPSDNRPRVEIEIAPNVWTVVDEVSITADAITYAHGRNGHREVWSVDPRAGVPRWRIIERYFDGGRVA